MNLHTVSVIIALMAAIVTFRVAHQVFLQHIRFACPGALAGLVAALVFLGVTRFTDAELEAVLFPYAVLGFLCLAWALFPESGRISRGPAVPGQPDDPRHPKGTAPHSKPKSVRFRPWKP
jgi:hypothetical protein